MEKLENLETTSIEENAEEVAEAKEEMINRWIVKFDKPHMYEGKTYKELDLSGLEDLSTDNLIAAEKGYQRGGGMAINPETTVLYGVIIASMACNLPIEFFTNFPAREGMKVKNVVHRFFYR